MTRREVYDSPEWEPLRERVFARDNQRCLFEWLLGAGSCSDRLEAHHIEPIEERPDLAFEEANLATVCSSHHPTVEALRRFLTRRQPIRRCPHRHTNRAGREACERSLNRDLAPSDAGASVLALTH